MPPNIASCGAATLITRWQRRSFGALVYGAGSYLGLKPEAIKTRLLCSQLLNHSGINLRETMLRALHFAQYLNIRIMRCERATSQCGPFENDQWFKSILNQKR